ncbi:30S ribosomal protein S6 [Candidatus Peregrinibacteria bacterium]|nr:30S ribosomal protein S6 [Candidatus Peregrinibacteria bacterium]
MTTDTTATKAKEETVEELSSAIGSYELMVIINPELREADLKKETDAIEKWVEKNKGKISVSDLWGKRNLAYRIKQHLEGYYAVFNFALPTDRAPAMNKMLRLEKGIIRYLLLTLPKDYVYVSYKEIKKEIGKAEPEKKVAEVVIEKKIKTAVETRHVASEPKPKEEPKKETAAEEKKKEEKSAEPVDKDLDAKLDKILGGNLDF